jgi:hypothetical protein
LLLTAVSLFTMPITQYLWTWDRFLQGGRDFELGGLLLLSFLSLVLVLSRSCKQSFDSMLSAWRVLASNFKDRAPSRISLPGTSSVLLEELMACPAAGMRNTPLQI